MIIVVASMAILTIGALVWYRTGMRHTPTGATAEATGSAERKVLYWTDPMVPGYRSDKPGKSPFMDMDLVPVYADGDVAGGASTVSVRPEIVNSLGIRTYTVAATPRARHLTVSGYMYDPQLERQPARGARRVIADIFDRDSDWLRPGTPAELRTPTLPGRRWDAVLVRLQADVSVGARSAQAELRVVNPDAALRPNTLVEVTFRSPPSRADMISVPREAVIRTGTRSVIVRAMGDGRFQPVDVEAGAEYGEWLEIVHGVRVGDVVVVSGQFLLDSESNLKTSLSRMQATDAPAGAPVTVTPTSAPHDHPAPHDRHTQ
jgi:hypothetical protein